MCIRDSINAEYMGSAEDPLDIYKEIVNNPLDIPDFVSDEKGVSLIQQLLSRVPEQRVGPSYASVKAHPWFDGFDWDRLSEQQLKAPFIPSDSSLISIDEIERQVENNRLVTEEIYSNIRPVKRSLKRKESENTDWDKDF
eukprot:TRINITY_DN13838_c0_g2_i1.p1 TRINITY_DN13838_c0_g2~~TRINITY_DN13838_c0_g2_i1.p1  ORF type:complete len:140 (-),score=38.25 TRINITY_DN13838_c0_g2_i1:124-543(-)